MLHYSLLLLSTFSIFIVPNAADMVCKVAGISTTCPTLVDSVDKMFCCETSTLKFQYCCTLNDYVGQNSAVIAGIVISTVIVIILITICCCCFCSCCYLAKRRVRGQVLYVPGPGQVSSVPPPAYPQVHLPPGSQVYNPSSYNLNHVAAQHPHNPYYN